MALLDRFRDFSKIDQSQTTADVEITSGVVHLPMVAGVSKIPLPHLAERSNIVVVSVR